jgi:hypothetical protein
MIAELHSNNKFPRLQIGGATNHRILFPEPAAKHVVHKITEPTVRMNVTFSVNPEQRTRCLPFMAFVAFDEPLRSSRVLTTTRDVVICGRIRW